MFFKKKPLPKPAVKALPEVKKPTPPAEDDIYAKLVQAFVDIQRNNGKSLAKTAADLERSKAPTVIAKK
jgi:hypothetical protein